MCLETFSRFRCGHTEYLDTDPCPCLEDIQHLIQKHGRRYQDHRIDRLYESCNESVARRYLSIRSKCSTCNEDDERRAGIDTEDRNVDDDDEMNGICSNREDGYVGALRTIENEKRKGEGQRLGEKGPRSEERERDRRRLSDGDKERQHMPHTKTHQASTSKSAAVSLSPSSNRQRDNEAKDSDDPEEMQM